MKQHTSRRIGLLRISGGISLGLAVVLAPVSLASAAPAGTATGFIPSGLYGSLMAVLPFLNIALLAWALVATLLARSQYRRVMELEYETDHLRQMARVAARKRTVAPNRPIGQRVQQASVAVQPRRHALQTEGAPRQASPAPIRQSAADTAPLNRVQESVDTAPAPAPQESAGPRLGRHGARRTTASQPAGSVTGRHASAGPFGGAERTGSKRGAHSRVDQRPELSWSEGGSVDWARMVAQIESDLGMSDEHRTCNDAARRAGAYDAQGPKASPELKKAMNLSVTESRQDAAGELSLADSPVAMGSSSAHDGDAQAALASLDEAAPAFTEPTWYSRSELEALERKAHREAAYDPLDPQTAAPARGSSLDEALRTGKVLDLTAAMARVGEAGGSEPQGREALLPAVAGEEPGWHTAPESPLSIVDRMIEELDATGRD
ncbi:MAG: hypothetical protein SOV74_07670 [Coriobacteriales bacterium]|nr:hypothetical protein [Coriobacteriales bacterium]